MPEASKVGGVLQAAATISKTTETDLGAQINCKAYSFLSIYFVYTKGDETGLDIFAYFINPDSAVEYQDQSWSAAAGTRTSTTNKYRVTATGNHVITFDIRGIPAVQFKQAGSNNDGTPTGTLAAQYTLSDE